MPRKICVDLDILFRLFLEHKDFLFSDVGAVVPPTNNIWSTLSHKVHGQLKPKYLYTILLSNRYNFLEKLKPVNCQDAEKLKVADEANLTEQSEHQRDSSCSSDDEIKLTLTLSPKEWQEISPEPRMYGDGKLYSSLAPGRWTNIIASHFWDHTKLPCTIVFKRSKVRQSDVYLTFRGQCKSCKSTLFGEIYSKPVESGRALVQCTYKGPFNICGGSYKRHLKGESRRILAQKLISRRMAPTCYVKRQANILMNQGDPEPSILPSLTVIRAAMSEERKRNLLSSDELAAVQTLKYISPYNNYIKDIGLDRFFVHYWSTPQIHILNNYIKTSYSKIAIDATGGVVKKIMRPNNEKSGALLLYDATIKYCDTIISVSNMISERHDSDSITHWLQFWKRGGVLTPNEVVSDFSIPLLSAIIRAFTHFNSLSSYLDHCYNAIVLGNVPYLASCYIRCDVAHAVKIYCSWQCLKSAMKRSRNFYKRCLGQLLQARNIGDVRQITKAIFIVALNETEGFAEKVLTPCSSNKKYLINLISKDDIQSNDEHSGYEVNDEELPLDDLILETNNFKEWGKIIYEEAKMAVKVGNNDNCQYLPAIVPKIIEFLKFLPLWSNILSSYYPGSDSTTSSATVESNFNILKNCIFSKSTLPLRLDDFIKTHTEFLEGSVKLTIAKGEKEYKFDSADINEESSPVASPTIYKKDQHKYNEKVTAIKDDLISAEDKGKGLVHSNFSIGNDIPESSEFYAVENWRGEIHKKRKRSSYLEKNSEWLQVNLSQKCHSIPISILRNGNSSHLQPIQVGGMKYIFTNTCGFDSIVHLLSTNMCDVESFIIFSARKGNMLAEIAHQLMLQVTQKTYKLRCELLKKLFGNVAEDNKNILLIDCQCTIEFLLKKLCESGELEFSSTELLHCQGCARIRILSTAVICINNLNIQDEMNDFIENQKSIHKYCVHCNSLTTSNKSLNNNYFFIEFPNTIHVRLNSIQKYLSLKSKTFILGGIVAYSGATSLEKNILGHFKTYSLRANDKWELYDDLMPNKYDIPPTAEIIPQVLFYRRHQ